MAKVIELAPGKWRIDMRNTTYAGPKEQLFCGTEKEVNDEFKRRMEEVQRSSSRDGALLPNDSPTILQACEEFMKLQAQRAVRGDIGKGKKSEEGNKRRHIEQFCALKYRVGPTNKMKVGHLTSDDIRDTFIEWMRTKANGGRGFALTTQRNTLVTIKQLLDWCVDRQYIAFNPARSITISLRNRPIPELRRIHPAEMVAVINAAPETYKKEIMFAAYTGLRQGEQRALTWKHVDFDNQRVLVRRAVKSDDTIGPPKTEKSSRSVKMSTTVATMMREWKMSQPLHMRKHDLVFPNSVGEIADGDNWRNRGLSVAIQRTNYPVDEMTWHDLRHFYASCLIFDHRTSDAEVAALLGHADINHTYWQYARYFEERSSALSDGDVLDDILGAAS
tara:strand:+ start:1080 stop:2249 length:1170 start_codon:yes stop_codon:yes gene_type:complete